MQEKNWEAEAKELSYQLVATQTSLQNIQNQHNTLIEKILSKTEDNIDSLQGLFDFVDTLEVSEQIESE